MKLAKLVEAERRGILSGRPLQILTEARRRGLVSTPSDPVAAAVKESAGMTADVMAALSKALQSQKTPVVNVIEREREASPAPRINVQVPAQTADHLVGLVFRVVRDRNGFMDYLKIERADE